MFAVFWYCSITYSQSFDKIGNLKMAYPRIARAPYCQKTIMGLKWYVTRCLSYFRPPVSFEDIVANPTPSLECHLLFEWPQLYIHCWIWYFRFSKDRKRCHNLLVFSAHFVGTHSNKGNLTTCYLRKISFQLVKAVHQFSY